MGESPYGRTNPYLATLVERYPLNKSGSKKVTKHLVLDLGDSGITYEAGDSIAVYATNDENLISRTLQAAQMKGDEMILLKKFSDPISIREAFAKHLDIGRVTRKLFNAVLEKQNVSMKKQTLASLVENCSALKGYLEARYVWDFLEEHKEVVLKPQELCDALLPLIPRLYSVASSQKAVGNQAHLTVGLVEYTSNNHKRQGVCSHFLCDLAPWNEPGVPLFVQPCKHFSLPADPAAPMIMVGPGTGVAPFRGFIQERIATEAPGPLWLFFGDWNKEYDYIYGDYWESLVQEGKLEVTTAFSRDQDYKIYVQDKIREKGKEVWRLLEQGGYFYVCGDAKRMAKDVDAALHSVVETEGKMSSEEAALFIERLKEDHRYQRDVY